MADWLVNWPTGLVIRIIEEKYDGQDQAVPKKRWYVVHAYSGFEKYVMTALQERIRVDHLEDKFGEILVPTEEVVELRAGQKRKSERKFFPGYVLVEMVMDEET